LILRSYERKDLYVSSVGGSQGTNELQKHTQHISDWRRSDEVKWQHLHHFT